MECHSEAMVTGVLPGGRVRVTVARSEACHSCAARGACKTLGGQSRDVELTVENPIGAESGDRVRLSLPESAVVQASAVLYLLPALGLIGGAAAGWAAADSMGWPADPAAVIGCLAGLLLGLFISRLLGRAAERRSAFVPRLTAITARAPTPRPESTATSRSE
ncbi:MAG: SoxR reducing system RseC family protein [Polyangia bacterium]